MSCTKLDETISAKPRRRNFKSSVRKGNRENASLGEITRAEEKSDGRNRIVFEDRSWPWRISCNWKRRSPPFQIAGNVVKACFEIEHEKRVDCRSAFIFIGETRTKGASIGSLCRYISLLIKKRKRNLK